MKLVYLVLVILFSTTVFAITCPYDPSRDANCQDVTDQTTCDNTAYCVWDPLASAGGACVADPNTNIQDQDCGDTGNTCTEYSCLPNNGGCGPEENLVGPQDGCRGATECGQRICAQGACTEEIASGPLSPTCCGRLGAQMGGGGSCGGTSLFCPLGGTTIQCVTRGDANSLTVEHTTALAQCTDGSTCCGGAPPNFAICQWPFGGIPPVDYPPVGGGPIPPGGPAPICGDANVDAGEQCDDAVAGDTFHLLNNADNDGTCVIDFATGVTCKNNICGDGYLNDPIEECDDGNLVNNDGCSDACKDEGPVCGDDTVEPPEQCEPGIDANCSPFCTWIVSSRCSLTPSCGDGFVNVGLGEQCDDGNRASGDGCNTLCEWESCGNGIVEPRGLDGIAGTADDEQCEPGLYANCGAVGAPNECKRTD